MSAQRKPSADRYRATITVPATTKGWGENKKVVPGYEAKVELTIDLQSLLYHLGIKAARSKGKSTKALAGKIKVKVLAQKEVA